MNYKVKDDNPAVGYTIELGEVKDAEGEVIDNADLTVEIEVSDPDVLTDTANADNRSGSVSFGKPGIAARTVTVKSSDGTILASGGDTFTVTTGDPASISSVNTTFEGLTPEAEAPAS